MRLPLIYFMIFLSVAFSFSTGAYAKPRAGDLDITHSWAPPSLKGVTVGSAYLTITNQGAGDDELLSAETPVARAVEIHTHQMAGDIIRMLKLSSLPLPAGQSAVFKPQGLHLMLIDLRAPLAEGETFPLSLHFKRAGKSTAQVVVQKHAP